MDSKGFKDIRVEIEKVIAQETENRKKNWLRERIYKIDELKRQIYIIETEIAEMDFKRFPLGGYSTEWKGGGAV
jgi:hypothetical protein